jgi:hypothetical protein
VSETKVALEECASDFGNHRAGFTAQFLSGLLASANVTIDTNNATGAPLRNADRIEQYPLSGVIRKRMLTLSSSELENAFEVGEAHLHLLALSPRS